MRKTGVLSINEALNHDDMVNLILQNVINNMQAALQEEDDIQNLTTIPENETENTNPVCRGSSRDTTANKINPYYLIG